MLGDQEATVTYTIYFSDDFSRIQSGSFSGLSTGGVTMSFSFYNLPRSANVEASVGGDCMAYGVGGMDVEGHYSFSISESEPTVKTWKAYVTKESFILVVLAAATEGQNLEPL
jgi:hypothetical protein